MTDFTKLCVTQDTLKSLRGKGIDSEINAVLALVAREMNKKYALCYIDSYDHDLVFDVTHDIEMAKELSKTCVRFESYKEMQGNGKLRIEYVNGDHFRVAEIHEIYDPYLVVYHHAYDGVGFRVEGFETESAAYDWMNREIQYALNNWETVDPEPYTYGYREYTLDDNNQWHHWEFFRVDEWYDYPDE